MNRGRKRADDRGAKPNVDQRKEGTKYNENLMYEWETHAHKFGLPIPSRLVAWASNEHLLVLKDDAPVISFLSENGDMLMGVKSKCIPQIIEGVDMYVISDSSTLQIASCPRVVSPRHVFGRKHLGKVYWMDFLKNKPEVIDDEDE